eukprot:6676679-Prymnesium_polylepis.1
MCERYSYPSVTQGPCTQISPSPCGAPTALPSSFRMRISGPADGPTAAILRPPSGGLAAIGMLSVMA